MAELAFLGAAKTVTGSKYLVTHGDTKLLVDCGLFQGLKPLRLRNWQPPPVDPAELSAVILTHAHIDHTGYLPRLVRLGYRGPVYASTGTAELCRLVLPDSGRLQEVDARYANRKGFTRHRPALPLYTERDAREALELMQSTAYGFRVKLGEGLEFRFISAGHILGSSFVELVSGGGGGTRLLFSGDLGRYDVPILEDPSEVSDVDVLVVESTYGDRLHGDESPKEQLSRIIQRVAARRGTVVIPAFAVGRTQEVLYLLRELEEEERIPILPVRLDSPMAQSATRSYREGRQDHDRDMRKLIHKHIEPLATRDFSMGRPRRERQRRDRGSRIVISASGMATGGRVLHHLRQCLPDERNAVVFVGYQAAGTRGRRLLEGESEVKIHGEMVPVKAEIQSVSGLSAHADYGEAMRWMRGFDRPPRMVYVTHGEPEAAEAMRARIESELGWSAHVPDLGETVDLDG